MALATEWAEERYEYNSDGRQIYSGLHNQLGAAENAPGWNVWKHTYDGNGYLIAKSGPYLRPWSERSAI